MGVRWDWGGEGRFYFHPSHEAAPCGPRDTTTARTTIDIITYHYLSCTMFYSLLTAYYSLPTTYYLLLATHYLLTTRYSLLTDYSLLTTHYSLPADARFDPRGTPAVMSKLRALAPPVVEQGCGRVREAGWIGGRHQPRGVGWGGVRPGEV